MDNSRQQQLQHRLESEPIRAAAAEWFVELQDEPSIERIMEWQRWLSSDERHRAAYEGIESLWSTAEGVTSPTWPKPAAVITDRYDPALTVSEWRRRGGHSRVFHYALAATVLLGVALALTQLPALRNMLAPSAIALQTKTGERREIRLSDGSIISVSARTAVSAQLTATLREIRIDSGEAFFTVAKDAHRPFVVHAGGTAITAVGTQFNVRQAGDHVVISVAEGVVQVDSSQPKAPLSEPKVAPTRSVPATAMRLIAGEQLNVASNGSAAVSQSVDTNSVGGWRSGKLHYLDETLAMVVADVGRYSARDIQISDPETAQLRITGTVFADDVESWLRTLEAAFPVHFSTDANGKITIRSSGGASHPAR